MIPVLRKWLLPLLVLPFIFSTHAKESWSDPRLPVTNGVALWFDVSRQTAARGASRLGPLRSWNDAPEILFDGSGRGRHLSQPMLQARPRFNIEVGTALLSFDGKDDFLAIGNLDVVLTNATLFAVASARAVGDFRALLSWNERGRNDYTSGLNFDFGSLAVSNLARINIEGPGFGGERDLLGTILPLNHWHLFGAVIGSGPDGVRFFLDGQPKNARPRDNSAPMRMEEFTLGARRYSNSQERPHAQGFFAGDLAEILVFDRVLAEPERQKVELYLDGKYGALLRGLGRAPVREGAVELITVSNPPPVQVHVPGFAARELPVELSNINNVRYRPDGKLVTVAYDGRIWLLSDTDGDGLEDKAEPFWDKQTIRAPIGAALTPKNYPKGQGVFIAGKEKLVLVVDTNGDDRADQEITVATWTERSEQQGVDALGVALGEDGSVYFSLGAASFTEPFLIDKAAGQARYRTSMERGTIQRVSPDFSKRETLCTGIRFAVGMAFNRNGDLFVTDQEGATWRHDGNPFDELLHIQPGRHYGFPPRHPRHLPEVIDEPSVFDYAPQHQSTCGLQFNDPVNGGPVFGPDFWSGDALVAGYSRGKLWRTGLVKTAVGYVAQTHLLATLQALSVDVCVSPRGDLVVATHSGLPDWGSGPTGKGKLWQIHWQEKERAQPVVAWSPNPTELRIAFDRPLADEQTRDLRRRARIEGGKFVFPGDRFETIRPGYQVVYDQLAAPRSLHEILGVSVTADRRNLILLTRPRIAAVNYVVTLPAASAAERTPSTETDLQSSLNGVEAHWESPNGGKSWSGWLPHFDLQVAREFTRSSADHDELFALVSQPGKLTLRAQLDLWQMLQPAIQPGSAIDWDRPPETVRLLIESETPFEAHFDGDTQAGNGGGTKSLQKTFEVPAPGPGWHKLEVKMLTGAGAPALRVSWSTREDPRPRAFPLRRFFLPFAIAESSAPPASVDRQIPEIAEGRWLAGRRLFFSDKLGCGKCHTLRGEGGHVGPELSNLIYRDYASVRKDIESPNAALNPDHVASVIELKDGDAITGIVQREADGLLQVATAAGLVEKIARPRIHSIKPAEQSLMPEGLWQLLSASEQRDLMTFLLTVPLEPAPVDAEIQGHAMPVARKRGDMEALMKFSPEKIDGKPMRIVLCASPKDPGHGGAGFHDYPLWRERWAKLLGLADGVVVETADRWPAGEQWSRSDLIVFYHDNPAWSAEKAADLDKFLERGGGLVFLHWSLNAYRDVEPLAKRLGWAWGTGAKFRHGVEDLAFSGDDLTADFPRSATFTDESYWNLTGTGVENKVIASSIEDGQPRPQIWLTGKGKGRVFVCIPGHFTWTFDDPLYRLILLRGISWSSGQSLNRLDELALIGARWSD